MAKTNERKLARILYVNQNKTAVEISQLVGVSEQTISKWVDEGAWKTLRANHLSSPESRIQNIKDVIDKLTQQQLELFDEKEYDPKEANQIADQISKWTKALEQLKSENEVPLSIYIRVMDRIFSAIQKEHPKTYMDLLNFQEKHLSEIADKL